MAELYPLKFKPLYKEIIWGGQKLKTLLNKNIPAGKTIGESWEISAVEENISVVSNGFLEGNNLQELIEIYMGDLVGEKVYQRFGDEFPLLIKFIDANDKLSIQVHPNDELAKKRHNAYGKTEMWYVIDAEPNAELITGFNQKLDTQTYQQHFENKTLTEILNREKVKKADVFFLPAGRVHAIGSGIVLAEIQQTSDITYRIYDWERVDKNGNQRELHTELALDAIDYLHYDSYRSEYEMEYNKSSNMVDCKYFTANILPLNKPIQADYNLIDSFVIYMCIEGGFSIDCGTGEKVEVKMGETVLLPAECKSVTLSPYGKTKIIEVFLLA